MPVTLRFAFLCVGVGVATIVSTPLAADARPLPDNDNISVVDVTDTVMYQVNPDTAAPTSINTTGVSLIDIDVDGDTGLGFGLDFPPGSAPTQSTLYGVDANSGSVSAIAPITDPTGGRATCVSMDYTAGVILASCYYAGTTGNSTDSVLGTIDPLTGQITPLWRFALFTDGFSGLATDPVTGDLYGAGPTDVFRIDIAAQTVTPVYHASLPIVQGDFDSGGVYWVTFQTSPSSTWGDDTALGAIDLAAATETVIGPLDRDNDPTTRSAWGITIWGRPAVVVPPALPVEPTLARTGPAHLIPGMVGGVAAVGLGALALAITRRRSKATPTSSPN